MGFSQEDFDKKETKMKLELIIMSNLGKPLSTRFKDLTQAEQYRFNVKLNKYITELPDTHYEDILTQDFNTLCNNELFTSDFEAQHYNVPTTFFNDSDKII